MKSYLAAGVVLLASSIGAGAQQATFCGGADTSGNCSSSLRSQTDSTSPQTLDEGTTAAVPQQRSAPAGSALKPSGIGSGFQDQPVGSETTIRGQQSPSLGTSGTSSEGSLQ